MTFDSEATVHDALLAAQMLGAPASITVRRPDRYGGKHYACWGKVLELNDETVVIDTTSVSNNRVALRAIHRWRVMDASGNGPEHYDPLEVWEGI